MALRRFGYYFASQSQAATRSRVPTAKAKAHTFSASQVAVSPNVLKSQETIEPMIPGRAAAALPAKLARARPRACRCSPTLSNRPCQVAWSRHRRTSPTTGERKHKCRDCHDNGCENRCDGNSLLTKQGANALSQCGVFIEEPSECLMDSVDLGTEGCSVRGEGFEPCLSFKLDFREYTLELSDSVSNLSLHFSVVCFRQFSVLPGEVSFDLRFSVVDTRQLCQVVCQLISHSRHCLFEPSQLSSGLGDPHDVDWLIINRRQGALNLFCALTCAVGYAGEVLEFDVIKVAREGFIRLLECFNSGATQTFPRVTGESQRSPHCICTTHSVL